MSSRYKIISVTLVPSLLHQIVNYPGIDKIDFSSVQAVACAAAHLSPGLAAKFMGLVPKEATFTEGTWSLICSFFSILIKDQLAGFGMSETVRIILNVPLAASPQLRILSPS